MSSFIGHALLGFALAQQTPTQTRKESVVVSSFFILLAWSPDVDYLLRYLTATFLPIRYTHSLGYALLITTLSLLFRNIVLKKYLFHIPLILFFLAPLSHLLLDFLVGVHANPYLFPLSSTTIVFPFGILPSAGHIDIHNYYFWRNLAIELTIITPLLLLIIPPYRASLRHYPLLALLLSLLFILGISIGFHLQR